MVTRSTSKRKKAKVVFSKRLQSKWDSCPTDNFFNYMDHARREIDKKETSKTIKKYIRDNFKGKKKDLLLNGPEWMYTYPYAVGATIEWERLEKEFPKNWSKTKLLEKYFGELEKSAIKNIKLKESEEQEDIPSIKKRSIADIVKEKTSDFIGEIENILDQFFNGDDVEYSVYDELKKNDAPYNMAKSVYDYYKPILEEAQDIVKNSPADIKEAYNHYDADRKKDYLELVKSICDEADKYMMSKKAIRSTRVSKPKAADKQIQNLKYLKESKEFKITSISPVNIIGSHRLITFNVKTRVVTEYICKSGKGFEVSGSTLKIIDEHTSRETKLRKPEDFLPVVMKKTVKQINDNWAKLTTKTNSPNPRINKDTIILRVFDK